MVFVLLLFFMMATLFLAYACLRLKAHIRFLKNELDNDGVLRGADARRFVEKMKNPEPMSPDAYRRAKATYDNVMKNSLK